MRSIIRMSRSSTMYLKIDNSKILTNDVTITPEIQYIEVHENFMKQEETIKYHESEQFQTLDEDAPVIPCYTKSSDSAKIDVSSMTSEELAEKRKELRQKIDGMFICRKCEYVTKDKSNLNKHIKGQHFVGLVYKCNQCNQEFSLQSSLNKHKSIEHKKNKGI